MTPFALKAINVFSETGVFALLAVGMAVSFRILRFPDLTAEGSFAFGGVCAGVTVLHGWPLPLVLLVSVLAGASAGLLTATCHTLLRVPAILAGILVWMAMTTVNLRLLGKPNVRLEAYGGLVEGTWDVDPSGRALSVLIMVGVVALLALGVLYVVLESRTGSRLRCVGANPEMARSYGIRVSITTVFGLVLANSMIGLSGALFALKGGYADINMGGGMLVAALAGLFIGASYIPSARSLALIGACVAGALTYRALVAIALELGFDPRDLRLLTAVLVLIGVSVSHFRSREILQSLSGRLAT